MIYKYTLDTVTKLEVSKYHQILSLQAQFNQPVIWIDSDPRQEQTTITITAAQTGSESPGGIYLGTIQLDDDTYVLHFYAKISTA